MPRASQSTEPTLEDRYLAGEFDAYVAVRPGDLRTALELPRPVPRQRLATALRRYARKLGAPARVFGALERLANPNSRAVVTGQQTGLLLGPNYTLAKAVSAVNLARQLDSDERPVVPVFWLASQDHDRAEVDHAYLLDLDEELHRIAVDLPDGRPIGRIALEPALVESTVAALEQLRVPDAHRRDVAELLREAAAVSDSFADWFGAILYRLLGEHGLIVLNPLEPDVAELFVPVLERELLQPTASVAAVRAAGEALRRQGLTPQLGRGRQATNLFFETDAGKRELLRFDGEAFVVSGRRLAPATLLELLRAEPGRLTPAAALRPVTQDAVLPTAAMVVGPGELRYFLQLREVFALHQVAMPLIWPRLQVVMLEPPVARILAKYGLDSAAYMADPKGRRDRVLLERHGYSERFERTLQQLELELVELTDSVRAIDPTLQGTVERAERTFASTIERLQQKTAAALARQDAITSRQFERLERHLLPLGQPQERVSSPFGFFLKFGVAPVLEKVLALPPSGRHEVRL